MVKRLFILAGIFPFLTAASVLAELRDPLDPFPGFSLDSTDVADNDKPPEQLIDEATLLFDDERPLDARTKLLKALEKNPKEYRAHLLLAGYYMVHVGHFRLTLKYVKQAQKLFEQKNGRPPYKDILVRSQHARLLYLLSQARLNLDDYQGSLDVLDQFTSLGYYDDWYPGTRAWTLMKLNRLDEAIKVAKAGIFAGGEPGRTLNILGILLSMTGEREASLDVFRQAIVYEMSMGKEGQPATPLNNSGEVYKEIFNETKAEASWLKATSLPDGCEHVLPSLNLALLNIDQLKLSQATRSLNTFEGCVAQYPLRNGEEHRALVELARGRIELYAGKDDQALAKLNAAMEHRQWFGKIGTSTEDLQAATLISLARALRSHNNHLSTSVFDSWSGWAAALAARAENRIRAAWYERRARQVLIEDLSSLEDLYVRNTDSMIEYTTFGEPLSGLPTTVLARKIEEERAKDPRGPAGAYYDAYLGENLLVHGRRKEGVALIEQALTKAREDRDAGLVVHLQLLQLSLLDFDSPAYKTLAQNIFRRSRPALRNAGFRLPVKAGQGVTEALEGSAFMVVPGEVENSVVSQYKEGKVSLLFQTQTGVPSRVEAQGDTMAQAVNKLSDNVFSQVTE